MRQIGGYLPAGAPPDRQEHGGRDAGAGCPAS